MNYANAFILLLTEKYVNDVDGTFDSILSWKLDQLYKSPIKCNLKTEGKIVYEMYMKSHNGDKQIP